MTKCSMNRFIKDLNLFNAALVMTGAIRETNTEKLYQELG